MPPSHRAFAFRWTDFEAERKTDPQIELTRFYDPSADIGLGLTWQRFQDTRAVLGRELPGIGWFQSEAEVRASLERVAPMVPTEGDLLLKMLRAAADRGLGLYVAF